MRDENFQLALEEMARTPASEVNGMLVMENADLRKQLAEKDYLIDRLLCELHQLRGTLQ